MDPHIAPNSLDIQLGVRIPLRDGIHLNATVYRPRGAAPLPALFTLTPYLSDTYHDRANHFARRGYAFVLVDTRGRGSSEGHFQLPEVDADGWDIVDWLARQDWCDGQVAMWGGSISGLNQLSTLQGFQPSLKTIAPAAAMYWAEQNVFSGPIKRHHVMRYLVRTSGQTDNLQLFAQSDFWIERYRELYLNHRPHAELDQVVGLPSANFQAMVRKPQHEFAQEFAWTPEQFRRINIPILTIAGQYDELNRSHLRWCGLHEQWGHEAALAQHHLVIGPWDHAGTRTPALQFGGLRFAEASRLDLNQLHLDWYDWALKGGPKPAFLRQRVAYYVTGAEQWKYADSLAGIADTQRRLYLNSVDGCANDAFHSGSLDDSPPAESAPDRYSYDPLDIRPAEFERDELRHYITDQRPDLQLFGAGLVYHSAPFSEATEISGHVKLHAWMSMDVPDTDFEVLLSELMPDGTRIKLADDSMRARYRESLTREVLVTPGAIEPYVFDGFTFFSRRIAKGSRLRLVIKAPNSIWKQKNFNGGGRVEEESGRDARTAHVSLYHDAQHPSHLELPLVTR
jgi:putative CocE/NonD family hydrolase